MTLPHRILRFAAVGTACFILQYCLMKIFSDVMHLYFAEVLAFMSSAQVNFALSQFFTWADRKNAIDYVMRWVKFNASSLTSVLIVNATVFWLLISLGCWMWASLLIANVASTAFTFVMNHFVVFREEPLPALDVSPTDEVAPQISSVSLFMPAHNEAENLPTVIRLAHEYFDSAGIDKRAIIVVDDGSTDDTREVIDNIQSTLPVTVVRTRATRVTEPRCGRDFKPRSRPATNGSPSAILTDSSIRPTWRCSSTRLNAMTRRSCSAIGRTGPTTGSGESREERGTP